MAVILKVAVNVPLNKCFSYQFDRFLPIGTTVVVNFNKRNLVGFIWKDNNKTQEDSNFKIKNIDKVLDYRLNKDIIDLIDFVASYYHYPIGEVISICVPLLIQKIDAKIPKIDNQDTNNNIHNIASKTSTKILNNEQEYIVNQIITNLNIFYPCILHGITGSGKTEVYLNIIEKVISLNKQALVLIPEINLTTQLLERFTQYFPCLDIEVINSSINNKKRYIANINAANGKAKIIIGTRLAVFTSFNNLGIIIVDEEHDASFKQNDTLRYNARDLAVWRAKYHNIPVILGSATPSLESLYNHYNKKYFLYKLTNRANANATLPSMKLVDLNIYKTASAITNIVYNEIETRLNNNEITLIFINQRGYSPLIICYSCGHILCCKNCSKRLVYHITDETVKCHHCGFSKDVPKKCVNCDDTYLKPLSYGTQKIENEISNKFPHARIKRLDKDSINNKKSWEIVYKEIHNHEIDILIGTQMLSKGHDIDQLTLVVALNVDKGLFSCDFRASELLFNQLIQVSGRAGRFNKPGLVLIETNYPKHILYQSLIKHQYNDCTNYLLQERKNLNLPPYTYCTIFRVSAFNKVEVMQFLNKVYIWAKKNNHYQIIIENPVYSLMQRLKNKERAHIIMYSTNRANLHKFLSLLIDMLGKIKLTRINWALDVDPMEL